MNYTPVPGVANYLDNLHQQAEQAQVDALYAQQQQAQLAAQNAQEAAAYEQQLQEAVAQQQKAVNDYLLAQQEAAAAAALAQQKEPEQAEKTGPSLGKYVDMFANDMMENPTKYAAGTHGFHKDNASLWNRKALDKWLQVRGDEMRWNSVQRETIRKQVLNAYKDSQYKFEVKERSWAGFVGDSLNKAADGALGGLAEILAAGAAHSLEGLKRTGLGGGIQETDFHNALVGSVKAARQAFGTWRSEESQDAEQARRQAQGFQEALEAMKDNPSALSDEVFYMMGMLFGAKGAGAAAKAGGQSLTRAGVTRGIAAGGAPSARSLQVAGLSDDVLKASANSISRSALGRTIGYAQRGVGTAAVGFGNLAARTNPLVNVALIEGASINNDVLRSPGAYNPETHRYTNDALTTGAVAGATNAAITYGFGKLFGTLEGAASRLLAPKAASNLGGTALGRAVINGGGTTLDDALAVVTKEMSQGSSRAAADILAQAHRYLVSDAGKQAMRAAIPSKTTLGTVLHTGKTITGSMLAEGTEEGLIGLVSSVALQGIGDDGVFRADRIDMDRARAMAGSSAALGGALGVIGGGMRLAQEYQQNKQVLQQITDTHKAYLDQVEGLQKTNMSRAIDEAYALNQRYDTLDGLLRVANDRAEARNANNAVESDEALMQMFENSMADREAETAAEKAAQRESAMAEVWALLEQRNEVNKTAALYDALWKEQIEAETRDAAIQQQADNLERARRVQELANQDPLAIVRNRMGEPLEQDELLMDGIDYSSDETLNRLSDKVLEQIKLHSGDYDAATQSAVAQTLLGAAHVVATNPQTVRPSSPLTVELALQTATQTFEGFGIIDRAFKLYPDLQRHLPEADKALLEELALYDRSLLLINQEALSEQERTNAITALNGMLETAYGKEKADAIANLRAFVAKTFLHRNPDVDALNKSRADEQTYQDNTNKVKFPTYKSVAEMLDDWHIPNGELRKEINGLFKGFNSASAARKHLLAYIEASGVTQEYISEAEIAQYRQAAYDALYTHYLKASKGSGVLEAEAAAEASTDDILTDADAVIEKLANYILQNPDSVAQEAAAAEAKKLELTRYEAIDASEADAVKDTAAAMNAEVNMDSLQDLFRTSRRPAANWDNQTYTEQMFAVQQQTVKRATAAIEKAFGKEIADKVVFVSPNSQSLADNNANAYVLQGDLNTVYVVARPDTTDTQFVYHVAHELWHQHSDVMVRGKVLKWGDYEQTMNHFATNPFVQELMGAMRSTYPELNQHLLAEEALAEIHAARETKGGWDILRDRWGITTDVPSALRAKSHVSFINKTLAWFRDAIAKLLGRSRGASDAELSSFFRVVSGRKPTDIGSIRTPEQAQLYKARMQFEAAQARVQHYHQMVRQMYRDFDGLPQEEKQRLLTDMARQNGDTLTEQELGLRVSYSKGNNQPQQLIHGMPAAVAPNGVVTTAAAAAVAPNFNVPTSNQSMAQMQFSHEVVRQTLIYPSRDTINHNPSELDNYVGVISLVRNGNNTEIQVHMNDVANGVVGYGTNPLHTITQFGDINEAMHDAFTWLHNAYPHLKYEQRHGTTFDSRAHNELTPTEIVVLNRAAQMGLSSPSVRRWTNWLRNRLPHQYIPILDKFLDFVELMRVRWVDRLTPLRAVEMQYEQATGNKPNVIARLTRDIAESSAFIHRNFNRGLAMMATGKQSLRDRVDAVWEVMQNEHVGQEKLNKYLYGLEEAVRFNLHINSTKDSGLWELDANGKRYLVDANNTALPRKTVTGFRFANLDTLDPNKGEYDLGGRRFMQALAALPVEQRNSIGRIVAEISATGRVVADLQRARGVITQSDHALAMYRGTKELEAAFPELTAQGVKFGGFFMTMRDDNTSAYKGYKESRGRGSAVQDVLKNTAEKWQADVAKAFRNNELANFALMVMSMPNKYFAIEPVSPRTDPNDPTGVPLWEISDKGELASTVVYINGVPVKLVAKSESAKMLFDEKAAHPGIAKVGAVNHFFNQFKTSLNPGYVVFGLLRDIMTGYLNINGAIGQQYVSDQDAARIGTKTLGYALKYLFAPNKDNLFYSTWRGQYGVWAEAYQRKGAGMQFGDDLNTGAFEVLRRNELIKGVRPAVDMLGTLKTEATSKAARLAETIAYPPETAMRLGAFRAYTEHLFGNQLPANPTVEQIVALFDQVQNPQNSDAAAAIIAGTKNLTSNFQQHGTDATVRNLFSFHNAVMQGTFSTLPQIFSTAHGRRTATIIMLAAVAAAVINIGDDETDEFGNSKYFQNRNRNRVIILGDDLQIPVSDEIGWIKNLADNIVGVAMNKRNVIDASTDQLRAMSHMMTSTKWGETDNAFTNALYAVTPTLGQPLIALSTGYDIFGRKLQQDFPRDERGKTIPFAADVERTTRRATDTGASVAEFLYGATDGMVDMTGDEVDAIGLGYFAGLYRAFARTQTESMLERDGVGGMVAQFGSEYLRPLTPMKIDSRSGEEWKRLGERIGVSMRHSGGILDVLDSQENTNIKQAQRIYNRAESKARKARSDMGLTYKQIDDMIERANASGRYADARDLRADRLTIHANADEIRMEALAEIRALGVQ